TSSGRNMRREWTFALRRVTRTQSAEWVTWRVSVSLDLVVVPDAAGLLTWRGRPECSHLGAHRPVQRAFLYTWFRFLCGCAPLTCRWSPSDGLHRSFPAPRAARRNRSP